MRLFLCLTCVAGALLAMVAGCGGSDSVVAGKPPAPVLRFSAIPDQQKTELEDKFSALADYLSQELDIACQYVPSSDYKASVEAFKNGDIQLAWFGGLTGVQARRAVPGARAIAQGDSDPKFKSYFIAHKDTGLSRSDTFPQTLGGLRFAFGSESSTSGRLMPEYFIRKHTGKSPREFFASTPVFSGSHDKTIALVESGQVSAGAVNFKVYEKRVAEGRTDPEVCKVIWVTPNYPDYNFTAHPDLDSMFGVGFTERLRTTLLNIDDAGLLAAFPRDSLIEASNEDYQDVAIVAEELGFLRVPSREDSR